MSDLTPKAVAVRVALIVALISTVLAIVLSHFDEHWGIWLLLIIFPVVFLLAYLIFSVAIEKFIYKKIKVIYKTIHNLKLKKEQPHKDVKLDDDIFNRVKSEVLEWDKINKEEIQRLKGLENYKRQFVGNVAHELKTPIFNIQGYLLTLLEGGLEDASINKQYLNKAHKNVERMIAIINDLDEITKLESGTISMNVEQVDIRELIKEAINSLEDNAKKKEITLSSQDDEFVKPVIVAVDKAKIFQVLINLINNSIKYGKEGGTTVVKLFDMHENILVEVTDDGKGIDEEHLPRLFERFYRVDTGRSRESGGSGLGLAIAKHIIEAHDQTINVRSTVDVGSTFSFTLKKG